MGEHSVAVPFSDLQFVARAGPCCGEEIAQLTAAKVVAEHLLSRMNLLAAALSNDSASVEIQASEPAC
jgi:hypothetical protein